jgi:tetratricopeptide (TPR) repeat protein
MLCHDGAMLRCLFFISVVVTGLASPGVRAEVTPNAAPSASLAVPVVPQRSKSEELDKLFAELQREQPANPQNTIAKIWTLWEHDDSPTAELLLTQSNKAMKDGAFATSETMLNTLIGSYPEFTEALNKRAMLLYNLRRFDEAMVDLDAVLDAEPRHFGALAGKAAVFQAQGQSSKAAEALREAIVVNPHLQTAKDVLKQLEKDFPNI